MINLTLSNGVKMPILGFGVYQIPDHAQCCQAVKDALEVGYRSFDTAQIYGNEEAVGQAISESSVPREDVFITTKVWISNSGESKAATSIDESLKKLRTDYVDLLLIHQPFGDYYGTYRALERALATGKTRAIGVSNFFADRLVDLCNFVEVKPHVNQVETHVFQQQTYLRPYLDKFKIQIESWGPFAEGQNNFFTQPVLAKIGSKYQKSVAQVALRFLIQSGIVVIPKSVHKERMQENFDVFDFELTQSDMDLIRALNQGKSLFCDHSDPDFVQMLISLQSGKTCD